MRGGPPSVWKFPNEHRETIGLRGLIETEDFKVSRRETVVPGRSIHGAPVIADLARCPICSWPVPPAPENQWASTPDHFHALQGHTRVKFILVDPKMVRWSPTGVASSAHAGSDGPAQGCECPALGGGGDGERSNCWQDPACATHPLQLYITEENVRRRICRPRCRAGALAGIGAVTLHRGGD